MLVRKISVAPQSTLLPKGKLMWLKTQNDMMKYNQKDGIK